MQRVTLAQPATVEGLGLFSAKPARITILPDESARGIRFQLGRVMIPATIGALSDRPVHPAFATIRPRCTSVGNATRTLATVEHILSALVGAGVTDAIVRVEPDQEHAEVPILDGSSLPFLLAIAGAGTRTLEQRIEPAVVRETIRIEDGDASILIEPSDTTVYTYTLRYPDDIIPGASVEWSGDPDQYASAVAPARTFSLQHEAERMQTAGLFTHLTPRDMLVIGPDGPIDNDYRLPDECARHKLLDLIGDLALVGRPLQARITATRSGHDDAHRAARAIAEHCAV